jgi:hypothetical protein
MEVKSVTIELYKKSKDEVAGKIVERMHAVLPSDATKFIRR